MKTCTKCHIEKPSADFYRDKRKPDGLRNQCNSCIAANTRRYYAGHAEEIAEQKRGYNQDNRQIIRARLLKKAYGVTPEEFAVMFGQQNGRCKICGLEMTLAGHSRLSCCVDHNHVSGKVRGLLCLKCNAGLGSFLDSSRILRQAATYLEETK